MEEEHVNYIDVIYENGVVYGNEESMIIIS